MSAASIASTIRPQTIASAGTAESDGSPRNKILKLLPAAELAALVERSEVVEVKSKQVLFEPEQKLEYAYFPENCVISLVTVMEDGDQVEAMTIGNDGFSGIPVFHEVETGKHKGCGQISGTALRIGARDFQKLARELPGLRRLLHRYSEFVFETVAQSAACNRLHVIEQRCARWLLMSQDRVGRESFDLTQEFLAEMLGVRRPGVTVAMGILEKAGLISHGRGNITVVNRPGLEKASCECYRTIRARQAKLIA
ncbi:MAG TPA: Crp/Fnr family transcriptional regulator [Gemmatimonadaceae bacterium]